MAKDSLCAEIGILTLTESVDIDNFIKRHVKPGQINLEAKLLTYEDLLELKTQKKWSAVILLHSEKLGRISLTDVVDARYDHLLKELYNDKGKKMSNSILCSFIITVMS